MKILSNKELECLTSDQRKKYYKDLQLYCLEQKYKNYSNKLTKSIIYKISPFLRNYELEIYGEENIPKEDSAVFISNHCNSHDFFTIRESFGELGEDVTPFGAIDCLNFFTTQLFKFGDVTLIDRSDKESSTKGMLEFSKKISEGKNGLILGESTWNLHPILPMQPLKIGATRVAAITEKVIIPTIFEYVEVDDKCEKESELYKKCIVVFGKPIIISTDDNLISKTKEIQTVMENMRKEIWRKLNIKRETLDDVNQEVYLNHTYLKKFKAFGFEFDSEHEFQFLLKNQDGKIEHEYCLTKDGRFVPGITHKDKTLTLM